jgi:hypothetical protein
MYNVVLGINRSEIDNMEMKANSFARMQANMSDLDPAILFSVKGLVAVVTGGGTGMHNHL